MGRKSQVEKLQAEVGELEQKRAALAADADRAETEHQAAQARTTELEALEAHVFLGEVSAEKVAAKRGEIEAQVATSNSAIRGLRAAIAELDRRIEAKREQLRAAQFEDAVERHGDTLKRRNKVAQEFGEALSAAARVAETLGALRAQVAEEWHAVKALTPADEDYPAVENADEPDWRSSEWKSLLELIETGPETPAATAAKRGAEARQRRASRIRGIAGKVELDSERGLAGEQALARALAQVGDEGEEEVRAAYGRGRERLEEKRRSAGADESEEEPLPTVLEFNRL